MRITYSLNAKLMIFLDIGILNILPYGIICINLVIEILMCKMFIRKFIIACFVTCTFVSVASILDDAKALYNNGKYAEAIPLFEELRKKSPTNGQINQWLGVSLYNTGQISESKSYFEAAAKRKILESNRYLAYIQYQMYDFDAASASLSKYETDLKKVKKELPEDAKKLQRQLLAAPIMLEHVEKIVIIDSITVDKDRFFQAYNLSEGCGTLNDSSVLPNTIASKDVDMVYSTETGGRLLWAMRDEDGKYGLHEINRLLADEWDEVFKLPESLNDGGDAAYPYLMPDGATLYFASNGENSIGGYDIYMSRKDLDTGNYLQPQNMGMPYNSPYDDYMLAIDETNNLGWWATGRNQIPGKVTIYVFIPNKTRENYSTDSDDVVSQAIIKNYKSTWGETDYAEKAASLMTKKSISESAPEDFSFEVYKGAVYHRLSDFKSKEGAAQMEELLSMQSKQVANISKLKNLRAKYEKSSKTAQESLKSEILQLENTVEKDRAAIQWMENSIRKSEQKQ